MMNAPRLLFCPSEPRRAAFPHSMSLSEARSARATACLRAGIQSAMPCPTAWRRKLQRSWQKARASLPLDPAALRQELKMAPRDFLHDLAERATGRKLLRLAAAGPPLDGCLNNHLSSAARRRGTQPMRLLFSIQIQ